MEGFVTARGFQQQQEKLDGLRCSRAGRKVKPSAHGDRSELMPRDRRGDVMEAAV